MKPVHNKCFQLCDPITSEVLEEVKGTTQTIKSEFLKYVEV